MSLRYKSFIASLFIVVMHTVTYSQCPTGLAPGNTNIVTNGDFSAGNVSFTSGYNFCNTANCLGIPGAEGSYTVGVDPSFYNGSFTGVDHTSGTGNFLIANGSPVANTSVWCQTVTFEPNSYYIISFWVSSLVTQNPASIQLYIDGFPFFGPITAPAVTGTWLEYNQTFQSGLLETTEVCLYNTHTDIAGNDFGIDDISIKKCECDLAVSAGPDKNMCYGDSVQLDGSGAVAYFWSPTNSLSCFTCATPYASPQETTLYYVTVSGPGGCVALDSTIVTVFPQLDLHARPDTIICANTSVQLHADGAVNYSWQPTTSLNNPNIANPIASPLQNTTYYLNAFDAHGCPQSDSATVNVFPSSSNLVVSNDTSICLGRSVQLLAAGADTYTWEPQQYLSCTDCDDPVASPLSTTTYTVTAIDSNGCSAGSDSVKVTVDLSCSHLVIPTAFSPNNDGRNDFFHALSKGVISFDLKLYSRWGQLLFSASNPDSTWDGKLNGIAQPMGVYIWVLKAKLDDGTVVDRKGSVTLVR